MLLFHQTFKYIYIYIIFKTSIEYTTGIHLPQWSSRVEQGNAKGSWWVIYYQVKDHWSILGEHHRPRLPKYSQTMPSIPVQYLQIYYANKIVSWMRGSKSKAKNRYNPKKLQYSPSTRGGKDRQQGWTYRI